MRKTIIVAAILRELQRAYRLHGRESWGRHEFYAILLEEVDELWTAIKEDLPMEDVVAEALQVAAMVVRYVETDDRYVNQRLVDIAEHYRREEDTL